MQNEELNLKIFRLEEDSNNLKIQLDLCEQNRDTKLKLLEEALTRRNADLEQGEENNK